MRYFDEVVTYLKERAERARNGLYNCIPLPFKRYRKLWPGIEKGKYICVTANQKIGKSKLCDFLFIYETIDFIIKHPEVKVKILYFCLEESPKKKYIDFLSHLLYRIDGLTVSKTVLESIDKDYPLDQGILDKLHTEQYQVYIRKFEEVVEFSSVSNPTGINKACRKYAEDHGHLNFKEIDTTDTVTGKPTKMKIVDPVNPYTPDDPEEYRIIILDNFANITTESGLDIRGSIIKLSKYFITLRDQLNYTIVAIQHQAASQEGIENFKLNKIKPSSDGLGEAKVSSRDYNLIIGLYSPYKYGIRQYEGYDIEKFKNHIRFMEIIEDRDYGANNQICPLYFNGAVSTFAELPRADDALGISKVYEFIEKNKKTVWTTLLSIFTFNKLKYDRITNRKKCS